MSRKKRKQHRPVLSRPAQLRQGRPGPAGSRLRLAQPDEAEIAAELIGIADPDLPEEAFQVVQTGLNATLVLRGLDGGPGALVREISAIAAKGRLPDALASLASVLVVENSDGEIVGASLTFPPGAVMARALTANLDRHQVLLLALKVLKIKGVAVAEHARGQGIGEALIRTIVRIYDQLGYVLLYGSFTAGSGLDAYYGRLGFEVLDQGDSVPLAPLFGLPIHIGAGPGEHLFLRWNLDQRK